MNIDLTEMQGIDLARRILDLTRSQLCTGAGVSLDIYRRALTGESDPRASTLRKLRTEIQKIAAEKGVELVA